MSTELFTMKQLADVIGGANAVRRWIRAGLLPAGRPQKIGRAWILAWPKNEIDAALRRREIGEERLRDLAARPGCRGRAGQLPLREVAQASREVVHV